MNGIRGKTPSSPPPPVQGQQQPRGINYPFVGAEEFNPNYQQVSQPQLYPQQQFQNYDVNKHSFGAPRMPSPGVGQQPPTSTTMYQQQGMRGSTPPFFPGNQQNVRQPRFPNVQNPNQPMWGQQIMYMPAAAAYQNNTPQIIVNPQLQMPQQRMQQQYNPSSNLPTSQATGGLYQVPPTGNVNFPHQGYNNPPVYYGQNNPQNRPPSASGQTSNMQSKKKKTIIKIVDPNTGKEVDVGSQQAAEAGGTGARTTPVASTAGTEQAPAGAGTGTGTTATASAAAAGAARSPPNEIAAQFAEQVAKAIYNHDAPGAPPPPQVGSYPSSTPSPQQQQQQQHSGPPPPLQQMPPPPGPSPLHQNVQPGAGMPPPNMSNEMHMEGQRMPPNMAPPHLVQQQGMGPGQSAPINIPVNPNRPPVHMDVDVTEMPPPMLPQHGADPMHNLSNHTDMESIDQPPASASMGSVPGQSQSLSNGTTLAQKPVQNISIQQSVSATSDTVKPSEVKPPSGSVRETSPNKPAPAPVKETEPTQSSRGEPVTVSVAKPVSERTVEPEPSDSDMYKTGASSVRGSTPEVHIMPPTPVEKESKVELEAPVVAAKEAAEPAVETTAVPKKEKGKKRANRINVKGEKMGGSEFDAYVDKKEEAETETKPEATVEKPAPEPEVAPVSQEPEKPREPSPAVVSQPADKKGASPVSEVLAEVAPTQTLDVPGSEETVPKITIKTEDVDGPTAATDDVAKQDDVDSKLEEGEIEEDSDEMMLKYKYCEDQWSPLNVEGKKHYDREFLLQFQFERAATSKPEGLPDIPDIILDKPINAGHAFKRELVPGPGGERGGRGGGGHDMFDFTPNYVWSSSGQQGGGGRQSKGLPRQPSNQKNKGPGGGGGGPPVRQINLSISKDIELHRAKEAWKPAAKEKKGSGADKGAGSEDDPDDLYKKTRSILNKLTPQKFQTLVSQMQALPIDSETKLKGVIDLVFEKAISEPNFSVAYANMCRCLSMFKVPAENKPREMVNFRAVLLTRCQREFEKDKSSEAIFKEKRQEIEKAEASKKDELKAALEYEESQAKRRSLGNIRFIGELFKLKMLTENIMHDCVFKLLRTKDPENLECLCRLLTTIGKELDVDKAKPRMDQYFQQMQKIVNDKKMSSRVRFMLQDVIDLRLNKWVPRRVDNNPKTIDQIHKEVAQEAQEKALLSQQAHLQQKQTPHGGGRGGGGGRRGPPGQMGGGGGADGWNTVGGGRSTPLRSVDRSIDPTKIRFSKQNVDESNIQLGPGGGANRFSGWGRGSTGGTTNRPSQEKEKQAPNTPANRFSVLNKPEEDSSRRYSGSSPARGDSGRGGFGRPPSLNARHSQESEREKALSAAKAIGGRPSQEAPRERSRGRDPGPESQPAAPAIKELSAEDMEKKTNSILDEFLHIQDLKEAILCVRELSVSNHHHFVYNAINHVIERSQVARRQTGHLLHDLVKDNVISSQAYLKGLLEVLEFAEDMEIDIPKIWQYYGELISPMIQDGSVQLSFLKPVCQPLLTSNKAGVLLAQVLHDASHREGHKKVAGLWASSGLQWTDFVPKNQVDKFLKDMDLEFTKGGDSAPTTPTTGLPVKDIADRLHLLIVVEGVDNENVFDWIESNVDEPTTKQPKFIRALMTAVCNSAIKGEKGKERVEPKEINKRNDLLQKYLDHRPDSELQALYALQALVTKLEHPPGVLRHMFDTLYDEDIISEDAFIQWEKSEDEPDGKGAALKQVVQFFTWLREAEDDS